MFVTGATILTLAPSFIYEQQLQQNSFSELSVLYSNQQLKLTQSTVLNIDSPSVKSLILLLFVIIYE